MEVLEKFVLGCLRNCKQVAHTKETWIHQAFGAVQFYIIQNPEDFEEVEIMWNKYKPHFERHIWGITFDL